MEQFEPFERWLEENKMNPQLADLGMRGLFKAGWNAAITAAAQLCERNASDIGEWCAGAACCEREIRELEAK